MAMKKWVVNSADKELAKQIAEECDIDPLVALIAAGRGYTDPGELEQLLSDEPMITDPHELIDIEVAAECINQAIEQGIFIAIFGDYDCDGVTATTILYDYLLSRNAHVRYYIPDRSSEGYGMNKGAIEKLANDGVGLIVTVDNGIGSVDEIKYAYSLGMRVVVTDHHIPPEILPEAEAIVDPHRIDCPSSFKSVCGAEVAFKLVCVLDDKEPEEMLPRYADLLAIGTVGDVMPLIHENRCIVKYGIRIMKSTPRTGISAILSVAGISKDSVSSGRIAFGIVPRINAAGRMGSADRAVKLLCSTNMLEALELANEIDGDNVERQRQEKQIFEQAVSIIQQNNYQYNRVIIVAAENWHHGIVGIVASKLMEKFGKPTVVLSIDGETSQGSGRSYSGFSLYDAISATGDVLIKFGGHELAAGLALKTENIDEFRRRINDYSVNIKYIPPVLKLDCRLNPLALTVDVSDAIKELEPFGAGNPTPIFGIFGITLEKISPIGSGKHLKLIFSKNGTTFKALLFGVTPEAFCFEEGDVLDIAATLETNFYNDIYSVSVQIKGIRISGIDDDKMVAQIDSYNSYFNENITDTRELLPSREEVGSVYKFISKKPASTERVKYIFLNSLGYAKTMIAIKVLTELGLVITGGTSGLLTAVRGANKTELMNSPVYRNLSERSGNND